MSLYDKSITFLIVISVGALIVINFVLLRQASLDSEVIKSIRDTRIHDELIKLDKKSVLESNNETVKSEEINLWRPVNNTLNCSDRIIEQYQWIKQFSAKINTIPNFQRKNIIVFDVGRDPIKNINDIQCPGFDFHLLCTFTKSEIFKLPYEHLSDFDAAVFANVYYANNSVNNLTMPPNVMQIIYHEESPSWKGEIDLKLNNAILASYFAGSDIVVPYGKWVPYNEVSTPIFQRTSVQLEKNYAAEKTKLVVAFISNCTPKRLEYINQLKQFINVDVYGKCGSKRDNCTSSDSRNGCILKVVRKYKFYLSFENSNCRDYITEKVFRNAYGNNVIPVVHGAHPDDYKKVLPRNSYILVESFRSPFELAGYLKLLNENDSLYNEYFQWKGTGEFYFGRFKYICRICGMLFYHDYVHKHPVYIDENSSWKKINNCLPNNTRFWNKNLKQ